jgi:NAD(P)-dependent dehydrogenase (short-subunit alcohol dehydrogenase family)
MILQDKCILVAGGTSGIGLEAVKYFISQGAKVIAIGKQTSVQLPDNDCLININGDLQLEDTIKTGFQTALLRFGHPDGLFHVAGGSGRSFGDGPLHEMTLEGWEKTLKLNAGTVMLTNQAFIKNCLEHNRGGSIVNLSSSLTSRAFPQYFGTHAYTAAKAAVEGLSQAAAAMYAGNDIRINIISPGLTDTPMAKRALSDEKIMNAVKKKQQLGGGRAVLPSDIVPTAALLLSDEGRFITGQNIRIDGGWSVTEMETHE